MKRNKSFSEKITISQYLPKQKHMTNIAENVLKKKKNSLRCYWIRENLKTSIHKSG